MSQRAIRLAPAARHAGRSRALSHAAAGVPHARTRSGTPLAIGGISERWQRRYPAWHRGPHLDLGHLLSAGANPPSSAPADRSGGFRRRHTDKTPARRAHNAGRPLWGITDRDAFDSLGASAAPLSGSAGSAKTVARQDTAPRRHGAAQPHGASATSQDVRLIPSIARISCRKPVCAQVRAKGSRRPRAPSSTVEIDLRRGQNSRKMSRNSRNPAVCDTTIEQKQRIRPCHMSHSNECLMCRCVRVCVHACAYVYVYIYL